MAIISGTKKTSGREYWTSDSLKVEQTKPDTAVVGRWCRLGNQLGFVLTAPVSGTTTGFGSSKTPTTDLAAGECVADFEVGHVYKCTVWGVSSATAAGTRLYMADADVSSATRAGELSVTASGHSKVNAILLDSITGASAHEGTRVMISTNPEYS